MNMAYDATATSGFCEARIASCLAMASSRVGATTQSNDVITFTASGRRPALTASARIAFACSAWTAALPPPRNAASAWRPPKARPAGDDPAWNSTGVPCGEYDVFP